MKMLPVLAYMSVVAMTSATYAEFDIETVVDDGMFNNRASVEIDDDGVVHIAYMAEFGSNDSSKEIMYSTNPGGEWTHIQITDNDVREELPSLTLDQHGNVHIAFHSGIEGGNKIQYVNNVGAEAGEFNDIIDITGGWYVIAEIRVDSNDVVHFTFRSQTIGITGEDVYYTTWSESDGVGPLTNLSNTPGQGAGESQIAIGPDDIVHIVYEDDAAFSGGPLKYLQNVDGNFVEVPTGVSGFVRSPMLLISDDNVVSIIYRQGNFLWAIDDGGNGEFSAPEAIHNETALPAFYERFAIDDNGHRHVAFASNSQTLQGIWYIGEDSRGWGAPVHVDGGTSGNLGTSIAVDSDGQLVVAYSISGFDNQVFADMFLATTTIDVQPCTGDLNGDGTVDVSDLLILLGDWGPCPPGTCDADLNDNGVVDVSDLLILLAEWGDC